MKRRNFLKSLAAAACITVGGFIPTIIKLEETKRAKGSSQSLQDVYNSSIEAPEIIIDKARGSVTLKRGS